MTWQEGRVGFRPPWNVFTEKAPRDQDAAQFLLETQTRFYSDTYAFLRQLGFKGCITASNWTTASPEVLGPLEKLSYMPGDFVDRHGYADCDDKGEGMPLVDPRRAHLLRPARCASMREEPGNRGAAICAPCHGPSL